MAELPDELMIELKQPITFNGKTIDAITLCEPTIGQIAHAQKKAGGFMNESTLLVFITELVTLVANQPATFISQMKFSDMMKASEYLMGFMQGLPVTTTS